MSINVKSKFTLHLRFDPSGIGKPKLSEKDSNSEVFTWDGEFSIIFQMLMV